MENKLRAFFPGLGRRKEAVATVRLTAGKGEYTLNGQVKPLPLAIERVFDEVGKVGQFNISVVAKGGGMTGQLDATILGVARALLEINPEWKATLRKAGYVTRDARIKERKKPGLKRARRAPQWAKR